MKQEQIQQSATAYANEHHPADAGKAVAALNGFLAGAALTAPSAGVTWRRASEHGIHSDPKTIVREITTRRTVDHDWFIQAIERNTVDLTKYEWLDESRSASQPGADADNLRASIAEVLKEREGYGQTCTGCHESEDGHDVGHYPFSDTFQCKLGSGCHECGGIGAVWEHYPDKTTDTDQSPSLPPDGVQGLVEALEKIVALQISGKVNERVHRIAREALTAYKNTQPC